MSADYTLYAVRPDEWADWNRLAKVEIWLDESETADSVDFYAKQGFIAGTKNEEDHFFEMINRFHQEGRALFVAEVSFLKAGLLDEPDRYIPGPVQAIHSVLYRTNGRPLDSRLARALLNAMNRPNQSIYRRRRRGRYRSSSIQQRRVMKRWLANHQGMYLSTGAE